MRELFERLAPSALGRATVRERGALDDARVRAAFARQAELTGCAPPAWEFSSPLRAPAQLPTRRPTTAP